jgi:hypothetical protein
MQEWKAFCLWSISFFSAGVIHGLSEWWILTTLVGNIRLIAEFNSLVKADASFEAELVFAISVNHSCELHHLPKAWHADKGKQHMFFLIDLLLIASLLMFVVHLTILWSDEPRGTIVTGLQ